MRRADKEITDLAIIESIVNEALVCRIAFCDGANPYIVPLSFGYSEKSFFIHSAFEGKKIDLLRNNSRVCIEIDDRVEIIKNEKACNWGMKYVSVIADGVASFIQNKQDKHKALNLIMEKYSGRNNFDFSDKDIDSVEVIEIKIINITGKQKGYY